MIKAKKNWSVASSATYAGFKGGHTTAGSCTVVDKSQNQEEFSNDRESVLSPDLDKLLQVGSKVLQVQQEGNSERRARTSQGRNRASRLNKLKQHHAKMQAEKKQTICEVQERNLGDTFLNKSFTGEPGSLHETVPKQEISQVETKAPATQSLTEEDKPAESVVLVRDIVTQSSASRIRYRKRCNTQKRESFQNMVFYDKKRDSTQQPLQFTRQKVGGGAELLVFQNTKAARRQQEPKKFLAAIKPVRHKSTVVRSPLQSDRVTPNADIMLNFTGEVVAPLTILSTNAPQSVLQHPISVETVLNSLASNRESLPDTQPIILNTCSDAPTFKQPVEKSKFKQPFKQRNINKQCFSFQNPNKDVLLSQKSPVETQSNSPEYNSKNALPLTMSLNSGSSNPAPQTITNGDMSPKVSSRGHTQFGEVVLNLPNRVQNDSCVSQTTTQDQRLLQDIKDISVNCNFSAQFNKDFLQDIKQELVERPFQRKLDSSVGYNSTKVGGSQFFVRSNKQRYSAFKKSPFQFKDRVNRTVTNSACANRSSQVAQTQTKNVDVMASFSSADSGVVMRARPKKEVNLLDIGTRPSSVVQPMARNSYKAKTKSQHCFKDRRDTTPDQDNQIKNAAALAFQESDHLKYEIIKRIAENKQMATNKDFSSLYQGLIELKQQQQRAVRIIQMQAENAQKMKNASQCQSVERASVEGQQLCNYHEHKHMVQIHSKQADQTFLGHQTSQSRQFNSSEGGACTEYFYDKRHSMETTNSNNMQHQYSKSGSTSPDLKDSKKLLKKKVPKASASKIDVIETVLVDKPTSNQKSEFSLYQMANTVVMSSGKPVDTMKHSYRHSQIQEVDNSEEQTPINRFAKNKNELKVQVNAYSIQTGSQNSEIGDQKRDDSTIGKVLDANISVQEPHSSSLYHNPFGRAISMKKQSTKFQTFGDISMDSVPSVIQNSSLKQSTKHKELNQDLPQGINFNQYKPSQFSVESQMPPSAREVLLSQTNTSIIQAQHSDRHSQRREDSQKKNNYVKWNMTPTVAEANRLQATPQKVYAQNLTNTDTPVFSPHKCFSIVQNATSSEATQEATQLNTLQKVISPPTEVTKVDKPDNIKIVVASQKLAKPPADTEQIVEAPATQPTQRKSIAEVEDIEQVISKFENLTKLMAQKSKKLGKTRRIESKAFLPQEDLQRGLLRQRKSKRLYDMLDRCMGNKPPTKYSQDATVTFNNLQSEEDEEVEACLSREFSQSPLDFEQASYNYIDKLCDRSKHPYFQNRERIKVLTTFQSNENMKTITRLFNKLKQSSCDSQQVSFFKQNCLVEFINVAWSKAIRGQLKEYNKFCKFRDNLLINISSKLSSREASPKQSLQQTESTECYQLVLYGKHTPVSVCCQQMICFQFVKASKVVLAHCLEPNCKRTPIDQRTLDPLSYQMIFETAQYQVTQDPVCHKKVRINKQMMGKSFQFKRGATEFAVVNSSDQNSYRNHTSSPRKTKLGLTSMKSSLGFNQQHISVSLYPKRVSEDKSLNASTQFQQQVMLTMQTNTEECTPLNIDDSKKVSRRTTGREAQQISSLLEEPEGKGMSMISSFASQNKESRLKTVSENQVDQNQTSFDEGVVGQHMEPEQSQQRQFSYKTNQHYSTQINVNLSKTTQQNRSCSAKESSQQNHLSTAQLKDDQNMSQKSFVNSNISKPLEDTAIEKGSKTFDNRSNSQMKQVFSKCAGQQNSEPYLE